MANERLTDSTGVLLPESVCPICGYVMDAATCTGEDAAGPNPGDFGVCLKCGEILVFTQDMMMRPAELKDMLGLPKETAAELTRLCRTIREKRPLG